jgi:hypothetical protein
MRSTSKAILLVVVLSSGCWFSPTKARVQVVEHKQNASGTHYAVLFRVVEPPELAGRYGVGSTRRSDLLEHVDGQSFEVSLNFTEVGTLTGNKPTAYAVSPPAAVSDDFFESATPVVLEFDGGARAEIYDGEKHDEPLSIRPGHIIV